MNKSFNFGALITDQTMHNTIGNNGTPENSKSIKKRSKNQKLNFSEGPYFLCRTMWALLLIQESILRSFISVEPKILGY